jgi:periplasmic protein TonB
MRCRERLDREHNSHERAYAGLPPRNLGWLAASAGAHALLIAALVYFTRMPQPSHQWVLAYVIDPGAGASSAGGPSGGAVNAQLAPSPLSPPERPLHLDVPSAPAKPAAGSTVDPPHREFLAGLNLDRGVIRDARGPARAGSRSRRDGAAAGSIGSGSAGGPGAGGGAGSGSGTLAHADYGASPPPDYPVRARRRGEQGTVMLRVLVGSDGAVLRAEIAQSSGYRLLDDAAVEAVRKRWRFVAARRDGEAVESWVIVPIRFALTEASARE